MKPVQAFVSTWNSADGIGNSGVATFSVAFTHEFEAEVPILIITPNTTISAGAEVRVFRSTDGGNTFETEGTVHAVFPLNAGSTMRKDINLGTGQYYITVMSGGWLGTENLTASIALETCWVITAYT